MVAFHVTRRGWLVAPSLSFRLRLLCMLRDPLNFREGAVCHMPTSAPCCSYFSPLNFAGAQCSQQAKGSKDTPNWSTPTFCRQSDVPLVKLVTQIRESISTSSAGRHHPYEYHLSQHYMKANCWWNLQLGEIFQSGIFLYGWGYGEENISYTLKTKTGICSGTVVI